MAADSVEAVQTPLAADDAFSILGSDSRIKILQVLGDAQEPLSFSELRAAVGIEDSGRFNYHLDKLEGSFLAHTEAGYRLLESGRRVVEAIYSGVLTDAPGIDQIQIDRPCSFCGAPIEVRVLPGAITAFCTSCPGMFGESTASGASEPAERGYLGKMTLPPAGFNNRSPEEIYHVAQVWSHLELLSLANGVCPRCAGRVQHDVTVCEYHDADGGLCGACGNRDPLILNTWCENCIFAAKGDFGILLYGHHALQAFKVGHGENLVAPSSGENPLSDPAFEVLSADPLAVRVTYRYDGDSITMAVDDELNVTEVIE